MKNLRVKDLMTPVVLSVHPDDTVDTVYDLMNERGIRHLTVVDGDGDLVGLVSHRDLLRSSPIQRAEVPLFLVREILRRTRVEEVMTSEVETAAPDTPASEAARILFENKFGCLPVLDERSKLVGILTESDFVRFFCDGAAAQAWAETLEPAKAPGRGRARGFGWFS
jgi:CBS domain-containing membrane protein